MEVDSRHAFHVCYVGVGDSATGAITDVLEPPYRVTVLESDTLASEQSLHTALADADCLVLSGADCATHSSWAQALERIRTVSPELPIIAILSSIDGEQCRSLLRAGVADIVSRRENEPLSALAARLRERVDDIYAASIDDVGRTVLEIARSLMGAAPDEIGIEIEWGLGSVGSRLNADRCLVFTYDETEGSLELTHSWYANAVPASSLRAIPSAPERTNAALTARTRTKPDSQSRTLDDSQPDSNSAFERRATTVSERSDGPRSAGAADTDTDTGASGDSAGASPQSRATGEPSARTAPPTEPDSPLSTAAVPGFEESILEFDVHAIPSEAADGPDIDVPEGFIGDLEPDEHDDAATHPFLKRRGLEALLAVPIVIEWELRGVLVVGHDHYRRWPDHLRRQLRTLGELIGYTLERKRRRRELVRKNHRLERFTSVVSHDLRNPLNVAAGSAQLLQATGDPDAIENIIYATDRMESMISDLLLLAREGAELGAVSEVSLEDVVLDAWNAVDTGDATLETADNLPTVSADSGRFRQALENLIRNAVEHGSNSSVTVFVEATADGFALEDDGAGIPSTQRERVFEEGFSGSNGTGLGLSIVESVVSAHGWEIAVAEPTRGGARFEVTTEPSVESGPPTESSLHTEYGQ